MDQQSMAKQMIDLQRTAFDNMMGNTIMFWNQAGTMMNAFLDLAAWLPEDRKKALREWGEMGKTGLENFKNVVDDGYSNLTKVFH
ncbi:MAG: hypothetical protein WAN11_15970 [Syntrophobacteraceae bacterium]